MLATLIDSHLSLRGQSRLCLVKQLNENAKQVLSDDDINVSLTELDRCLQLGTNDEFWLKQVAETLDLDKEKLKRANRVTLLMSRNRQASQSDDFTPHIELILEGLSRAECLMALDKVSWVFNLHDNESIDSDFDSDEGKGKQFSLARKLYKQQFIYLKGRIGKQKIMGFRYYWAEAQALEFDIYGQAQQIIPLRAPPKKRVVSRRVLLAVGQPKLLVLHS